MSGLSLKYLRRQRDHSQGQGPNGFLDVSKEGVCPKTGEQMRKVKLMGCSKPQTVWYCDKSRIALPMSEPDLL